jgi:hypothetical protein
MSAAGFLSAANERLDVQQKVCSPCNARPRQLSQSSDRYCMWSTRFLSLYVQYSYKYPELAFSKLQMRFSCVLFLQCLSAVGLLQPLQHPGKDPADRGVRRCAPRIPTRCARVVHLPCVPLLGRYPQAPAQLQEVGSAAAGVRGANRGGLGF